jgi:hypothetical protein
MSVDCAKGTFFDFEANEGGGVLDLIEQMLGLTGRVPRREFRARVLNAWGHAQETCGSSRPTMQMIR